MTTLYFNIFEDRLPDEQFAGILEMMPDTVKERAPKFWKWQDAHAFVFGRLLLLKGLRDYGVSPELSDFKSTKYGKPYLSDSNVVFNVSHSGNCVAAIVSTDVETIGLDVELIRAMNIKGFRGIWTASEWDDILLGGPKVFFDYWTRKEAVAKADGRGLSVPLNEVDVRGSHSIVSGVTYEIHPLPIGPEYILHIAAEQKIETIRQIQLSANSMLHIASDIWATSHSSFPFQLLPAIG